MSGKRVLVVLPLALVILTCCGPSGPTPSASVSAPASTLAADACMPEPSFGAATGRLLLRSNAPAAGSLLYMSRYVGPDDAPLVVLDPARDLHAEVDSAGTFCFTHVAPGKYALIVWNAVDSVLLEDPVTGYSLTVYIEAGKTTDVGTLYTPVR